MVSSVSMKCMILFDYHFVARYYVSRLGACIPPDPANSLETYMMYGVSYSQQLVDQIMQELSGEEIV